MSRTRFGFTPAEWIEMCDEMRRVLADVAAQRGTITYGELAMRVSGRRISARSAALMELLDDACREEDAIRGTILASLVVRADSGMPGEGYFMYLEEAGEEVVDRETFWRDQVGRVWDAWAADGLRDASRAGEARA